MGLSAIECPDGLCHSHHGGHAVERETMQSTLQLHGKGWCERLAERIYEISVDTFSQSVMPSLHTAGWQRRHLDWEFKLNDGESEPDRTLVDGMINATESFLRSSEVHRLFIQELVQGTFAEADNDDLRIKGCAPWWKPKSWRCLRNGKRSCLIGSLNSCWIQPMGISAPPAPPQKRP
jgi:hypothetical protein